MFLVILVNKNASEREHLKAALKQVILLHWLMLVNECLFQTKRWLNDDRALPEQNYLHVTLKTSISSHSQIVKSCKLKFQAATLYLPI